MRKGPLFVLLTICLAGYAVASNYDHASQEVQEERYCEKVAQFVKSKGEFGWPDYRGIAFEFCDFDVEDSGMSEVPYQEPASLPGEVNGDRSVNSGKGRPDLPRRN